MSVKRVVAKVKIAKRKLDIKREQASDRRLQLEANKLEKQIARTEALAKAEAKRDALKSKRNRQLEPAKKARKAKIKKGVKQAKSLFKGLKKSAKSLSKHIKSY